MKYIRIQYCITAADEDGIRSCHAERDRMIKVVQGLREVCRFRYIWGVHRTLVLWNIKGFQCVLQLPKKTYIFFKKGVAIITDSGIIIFVGWRESF